MSEVKSDEENVSYKESCPSFQEINTAVALFTAGRYMEAVTLAQAMTLQFPLYAFGWTVLGEAYKQMGQSENALTCMQKAVELSPGNPDVYTNLGNNLLNLCRLEEAAACFLHALQIKPDYAQALNDLGITYQRMHRLEEAEASFVRALQLEPDYVAAHSNLGVTLKALGRLNEAETSYRRALQIKPDYADVHCNLGNLLKESDRLVEAEASYLQSLQIKPDYAEAHYNLGVTLKELGRLNEAEASYRQALHFKPDFAEAYSNLGAILMESGRLNESETSYRMALQVKPDCAEVHSNLGNVLRDLGQLDAAVASYRQALEINPDYAEALYNLCNALLDIGQLDEAVASYRRVLEIRPDYAEAHNNLGIALKKLGRLEEAEASCQQAIKIKPDFAEGYTNLGGVFKDMGRLDEAIACDRRAIELDPGNTKIHSNFLYTLYFHPACDDRTILAEVKQFAAAHPLPCTLVSTHAGRNNMPKRRLRIGYVSPDFRNHCQSLFTIPLLSNHDHTKFEIYCYAQLARPDKISERLATYADGWRSTHLKSDAQLAETIASDGIDILVDLTMHMANGRPMLFARKPAPVQVAWLAYPGTTGLPAMDYRFTDPWLDPPELGDEHYTETSIRLPDTFWCYDPLIAGLQPNPLPALSAGYITFGCLNNFCKVSDDTLCRWGRVMARLPSSRLILLAAAGLHRQHVFNLLARNGIAAERIEFVEHLPRAQYLQTYQHIDICLDTLPYNGHTTSLDAYWMGVPVISQVGHTVVGRAGWSQLNNLGLAELAAFDEQAFIDITVALATDLPRLSQLRHTLRGRLEASPLMDGKRFATAIETAYSQIWQNSCGRMAGR